MAIAPTNERKEDLARWIWTLAIVGFFAIQAVIWCVAVTLTFRDPSFAVAPRYEQEAENWDAKIAQRRASQALGWAIEFAPILGAGGDPADLQIRLVDRHGQPLDGAEIDLNLFHCARAAEAQQPVIRPLGQGLYTADSQLNRKGLWKMSGVARRGNEVWYFDQKQQIDLPGGAR